MPPPNFTASHEVGWCNPIPFALALPPSRDEGLNLATSSTDVVSDSKVVVRTVAKLR